MDMDDPTEITEPAQKNGKPEVTLGVILPIEQAQAILNYLTSCRYADVHELVGYLVNATPTEQGEEP